MSCVYALKFVKVGACARRARGRLVSMAAQRGTNNSNSNMMMTMNMNPNTATISTNTMTSTTTLPPPCTRSFSEGGGATQIIAASISVSSSLSSPKLQSLYDDITKLPEEDVHILGALVLQVLGRKIFPGEFGRGLEGLAVAGGAAQEEEVQEVKTAFSVKLMGFDAKAKIKVIKEVRAIAGLGLKEAKELVESAPKVIQKDVKQDKADELKAQLEAVGAHIEIE